MTIRNRLALAAAASSLVIALAACTGNTPEVTQDPVDENTNNETSTEDTQGTGTPAGCFAWSRA